MEFSSPCKYPKTLKSSQNTSNSKCPGTKREGCLEGLRLVNPTLPWSLCCLLRALTRAYLCLPKAFTSPPSSLRFLLHIFMESCILNKPFLCSAISASYHQMHSDFIFHANFSQGIQAVSFPHSRNCFFIHRWFPPSWIQRAFALLFQLSFSWPSLLNFKLSSCTYLETKPWPLFPQIPPLQGNFLLLFLISTDSLSEVLHPLIFSTMVCSLNFETFAEHSFAF